MTIYLDYHESNGELQVIGIKEDNNVPTILDGQDLDKVIDFIMGNETIVVFGKPYYVIKKQLIGIKHILEDEDINERWTDIKLMINKSCGLNTTISKINEAMWGKEEKIMRLQPHYTDYDNFKLEEKITQTLDSIERIWTEIENNGRIAFIKKYETIWVELNANTYSRDDSV